MSSGDDEMAAERPEIPAALPIPIPERGREDRHPEPPLSVEETSPGDNELPKSAEETLAGLCRDRSHLPRAVPHFVNRDTECETIKGYLCPTHNCRCVLIHGATGIGKTAMAIKVANDRLNSDSPTVVVYVNCRYIKSFDDFSEKVLQQVYHYPLENPMTELKNRLKSQDFYTILLLDNFEFLLHLDDSDHPPEVDIRHVVHERMNPSKDGSKVKNFINEFVMISSKVKLLVTSSETVYFPDVGQEMIHLSSFKPEESVELLKQVWKGRPINQRIAHELSQICSGIPLVLFTLASSHSDLLSIREEMDCSSPQEKFEFLQKIKVVPDEKKIDACLDVCFGRLNEKEKHTLISFALLRGRFFLSQAAKVFRSTEMSEEELRRCGLELARRSLLEENIIGDACLYTFLRVVRDYCETKETKEGFREVFLNAHKMFIDHFMAFLEDTFEMFLSKNASEAISVFQKNEENVMQLIEWCTNGKMDEEQIARCVDVFNRVGELLAKMMGRDKFKDAFERLRKKCEDMGDKKRLSECLTSLGIKEVFNCSCPPIGLCDNAAGSAKMYLSKADKIQCALGISTGNSRAQCLAKLGRCLAKEGNFIDAKEKIQQAIDIRKAHGDEDIVMLGATFNDQGVILSLEEKHLDAIEVREQQTLPIYRETLGSHPFSATILNNLSNNYCALGEYDIAKQYSKEALEIRHELLKDHRDTAKSLFDLGMAHKKKEEFEEAKYYLEKCAAMQTKILDDNSNDLERTRKELKVVNDHLPSR